MKTYKNNPEGFNELKRKLLLVLIPLFFVTLVAGSGIGFINGSTGQVDSASFVMMILMIGMSFFVISRGLNKQRKIFKSYLLIIEDDVIQREQEMTPLITLKKNEITEIIKCKNGSIMIKGQKRQDVIIVSKHIANYETLESDLQAVMEIKAQSGKGILEKMSLLIVPILLGLMAAIVISTNKYLVLISAAIVTIIFGWSLYEIKTNKNIDERTKKSSWALIIVIVAIITIVYSKVVN